VLLVVQNLSAYPLRGRIGRQTMRNTRMDGWRTRWLTEGFGLGPFTFGNQIESKLRKEINFTEFSKQLHEQLDLVGLEHLLRSRTVSWLYEIALRARGEKQTVNLARRYMQTRAWRNNEKKTDKLIALLNGYPLFDPERILRSTTGSRKDSRTRHRAAQLLQNLHDLKYQFKWWSRFAAWGPWRASYKGYVIAMDNHLRKHFRDSLKKERGEVIEAVFDASGLNQKASAETILRDLRRERRKRKYSGVGKRTTIKKRGAAAKTANH